MGFHSISTHQPGECNLTPRGLNPRRSMGVSPKQLQTGVQSCLWQVRWARPPWDTGQDHATTRNWSSRKPPPTSTFSAPSTWAIRLYFSISKQIRIYQSPTGWVVTMTIFISKQIETQRSHSLTQRALSLVNQPGFQNWSDSDVHVFSITTSSLPSRTILSSLSFFFFFKIFFDEKSRLIGKDWCWERLRAGGEGGDRGWDGWMVSSTQWTWV